MANKQKEYQGYKPPFTLSARAVGMVADIAAQMERFAIRMEQDDALRLRKANRIKTIHSSLAIEGNHLLESEVADILDVENMVYSNQQAYYDAIAQSTKQGESGPFIEFMLEEIYKSVLQHKGEPLDDTVNDTVKTAPTQEGIIDLVRKNPLSTYDELAAQLGVGRATIARNIAILKDRGVLERVGEDKNGYWKLKKIALMTKLTESDIEQPFMTN
ncbi:MAG: winged helix-turn-helix transcriptional regulator [Bacteroidales bacterium]|nr:winged helix-turn-helix transcriptional regulator [Bacteroidales bacterium]